MALKTLVVHFMLLSAVATAVLMKRGRFDVVPTVPDTTHQNYMDSFLAKGGIFLDFVAANVTANNLGGKGPWDGEKYIRLDGVATYNGRQIDLKMEAAGDKYTPKKVENNKKNIHFFELNLDKGTETTVIFTLLDHLTNESVVLPLFLFGIWDFDMGGNPGKLVESATVTPMSGLFQRSDSLVGADNLMDDTYHFYATKYGNNENNPSNLSNLSTDQLQRAIGAEFTQQSTWTVTFAVSNLGSGGRNFLFSGDIPPIPYTPVPCNSFTPVDFSNANVVYSNLGGAGPDTDSPPALKIANVATENGQVDLIVEVSSKTAYPYNPFNASKNGLHGSLVNFNFAAGSHVHFDFTFMSGDAPVGLERFFITFLDIDQTRYNSGEYLTINSTESNVSVGFEHYYLAEDSALIVTQDNSVFEFASSTTGTFENNPDSLESLSDVQQKNAVAFFFQNRTSTFSIDYRVGDDCWTGRNVLMAGVTDVACKKL